MAHSVGMQVAWPCLLMVHPRHHTTLIVIKSVRQRRAAEHKAALFGYK